MRALVSTAIRRPVTALEALGIVGAALYTAALFRTLVVPARHTEMALVALPVAAAAGVLVLRVRLSAGLQLVLWWTGAAAAAAVVAGMVYSKGSSVYALPLLLATAVAVNRFPAAGTIAAFLISGTYGSLTAFGNLPAGPAVDALIAGAFLGALWTWAFGGARRPVWLWPGVLFLGLYVAASAAQMLGASTTHIGLYWFRASVWYLAAGLLVGYAPWPPGTRLRIVKGMLVVAALVGGYATLRWAIGPAAKERALALQQTNSLLNGELRPVGSFPSTKELDAWCAIVFPFCFAAALALRALWRLVSIAACVLLLIAMLASDVRAGPGAAAPGVALVLVLFLMARAFPGGVKAGVTGLAVLFATGAIVTVFAITLADKPDTSQRYSAIIHPTRDPSFLGRQLKWSSALTDIHSAPLGHGPGTAGRTQKRFGRYVTIGSFDIDNSYLTIAYQQGFAIMVIFAAGALVLLLGLVRRAIGTVHPLRAGIAIGAAGTLTTMLVIFYVGDYVEGLPALAGWVLVGLGVGQFASVDPTARAA